MSLTNIVELVRSKVIYYPDSAVYISGGIDSTIIVHHLLEKYDYKINTYSASFDLDGDETNWAKMVAEHYGTIHKTIDCSKFLDDIVKIMKGFDHPRYNVWAYYLAIQAKKDGIKNVYVGEGADEHFGGYFTRSYLSAWVNQFTFVKSMYQKLHDIIGLNIHFPFHDIDWRKTFPYYSPPDKLHLVLAYKNIIPKFITEGRSKIAPAFSNYWQLWHKFLRQKYPNYKPDSIEDIRRLLRYIATSAWIEVNRGDYENEGT